MQGLCVALPGGSQMEKRKKMEDEEKVVCWWGIGRVKSEEE